ncbi:hypothetical protein [Falsirhodobacter deserti]|uniref:hypothetical protein n=1 Tax=Falsirhodobacter deserti TaxID=1365611 RepID=UPI000FE2ADCB|nr:hypothetical protein [Falsirhodobacter deserti]
MIIAGHDEPTFESDDRIIWESVSFPKPESPDAGSLDKTLKRKAAVRRAAEKYPEGFYFFILDADDLIDQDMVEYIRRDDNRNGYFLTSGYVLNEAEGHLALMSPENKRPFYKSCGSCAAVWFSPEDFPSDDVRSACFEALRVHGKIPEAFQEIGRPIQAVPFPGAVYVINNGANLSVLQGKSAVQTRHASSFAIVDEAEVAKILSRF